jgi:hypothetical protein
VTRSQRAVVGRSRRSSTRRGFVRALCVGLATAALRSGAAAQGPATESVARISGVVRDKTTGSPIASAQVLLVTEGRLVESDATGHYLFPGLPVGTVHLRVRARSYPQSELVVVLRAGDDLQIPIALDSTARTGTPQELAAVAVTAAAPIGNYRLNDFERRKRTGIGQYLTDDDIQRSGAANLQDVTRGMRGVTLHCGGTESGGCRIQMVRAPINCQPEYVVDERVDNVFGPLTPIRDILAVEVYTGATDVPGEFAGTKAGCGVVVIWTRSAPARRDR